MNMIGGLGVWIGVGGLALFIILAILDYAPPRIIIEDDLFVGPEYGWWFLVYIIPMVVMAVMAEYSLVKKLKVNSDPVQKNRISYLIVAVGILIIFGFGGTTPLAGGFPISHIGGFLSACVLAYTILKHGLVSINSVLRRVLGWSFSLITGICTFALVLFFLHIIFDFELPFITLSFSTLSALVVALLIYRLRPTVVSMIDYFFFRDTYSYRQVLLGFDREMSNIISLDELADKMLPAISSALRISQVDIFFQDVGTRDFTTQYSYPKKNPNNHHAQIFTHDNPIVTWLQKETNPLNLNYIENISQLDGLWQPERDSLATSNIELLCPIKSRGELIGILALGVKKGGGTYSQEDIEMITGMAGKAGIIVENARMFTILRQQQQQVQHLLNEAIQAQENERQRISADLHDSVAQWLAGASYQTQTVEALLSDTNGSNIRNQLNLVEETIDKSLTELRRVLVDLRPPSLDELGLSHSLHQSLTSISSDGLVCNFHEEGDHTRLDPSVEITVYRVVQEALNNIRKHSEATRVDLYLNYGDENVIVKIKDNGVGFDLTDTINNAISVGNLGLLGMKQRVDMLGGEFDIQTRHGKGTTITLTLPLHPHIEES
ncbi:MAG TPA: GAF domain-containing sensor histidine kinase [Dehalococcoidia bacterium]|nr:GAF domain-containing sensor histidine kinase [Dehalococcoidia bacterium]